ncbi:hypothetical protein EEB12_03630 [Rhodococcus sp. WS1]|uniref:serine hydrolase n=1 Tax=Rhodococcus TaxID=1827 RepID=UPI000466F87D|nr:MULTISPECIES: serine hydrolase [Rhodococcus]ROZ59101.1 hypothetical protein EEB12_03630 [Rhodococcus sp. WS1]TQC36606.1 hypothetical protein EEB16_19030 [Rhodococcus sp. WS7]SUE07693.1 lipoprotein [Rhodococcus erythropolis]
MSTRYVRIAAMAAAVTFAASCSGGQNPDDSMQTPAFPDTNVPVAETLDGRLAQAQVAALGRGADVSIAVLDRSSDRYLDVAGDQQIETASVAKLFIAEDLLHQDARGERPITDDDRTLMAAMLESSDDTAANLLWDEVGGQEVITRVAERYALTATTPPWDGMWWNTETTTHDLVTFYNGVLDDSDQLGPERVEQFVEYLRQSTPEGTDGYDQRFGLPEALFGESVIGVKQGWMCCVEDKWIHLSTGIVGDDNRYIIAIGSREDVQYTDEDSFYPDTSFTDAVDDESALHARDTVTGVTQILFPSGSIDDWAAASTTADSVMPEASGP